MKKLMRELGYRCPQYSIYKKDVDDDWSYWIAFDDDVSHTSDISIGVTHKDFESLEADVLPKQSKFLEEGDIPKGGTPLYMARASDVEGIPAAAAGGIVNIELADWVRHNIPKRIEPFLQASCSFAGALSYLETYSMYLPMYDFQKPMLLWLQGDREALEKFARDWTPRTNQAVIPEPKYYKAYLDALLRR